MVLPRNVQSRLTETHEHVQGQGTPGDHHKQGHKIRRRHGELDVLWKRCQDCRILTKGTNQNTRQPISKAALQFPITMSTGMGSVTSLATAFCRRTSRYGDTPPNCIVTERHGRDTENRTSTRTCKTTSIIRENRLQGRSRLRTPSLDKFQRITIWRGYPQVWR